MNDNKEPYDVRTDLELITDLIKTTLKDLKINDVVDSSNRVKIERINADKDSKRKNLLFWKFRFIKEIIINVLVLFAIVFLSINGVIEGSIVGTLLGSVIGYSIGNGLLKNNRN